MMKQTRNFWLVGAIALTAGVFSACGGGSSNSAEAEAAALPTDGILGEYPKAVAEYEAAEAAASAKYEELKKSDRDKANEFWSEYIHQGNTTKFKKETVPAIEKTLEGREIPTEVAEGLPVKLEKNLTLDDKRNATTTGVFTEEASNETQVMLFRPVAFDADGNPIAVGKGISFSDYPITEGKKFSIGLFITAKDYDAARWARLKKVVIMDKSSDAFKQAEEQIEANKKAFKEKGKEAE